MELQGCPVLDAANSTMDPPLDIDEPEPISEAGGASMKTCIRKGRKS